MTRDQYMEQRNALLNEAETLINEGKLEESAAKAQAVKDLDAKYQEAATARANLAALTNSLPQMPTNTEALDLTGKADTEAVDAYDTTEYRNAFMAYVMKGKAIPAKFANETGITKTADVGVMIPTTTLQKIVERMEQIGMILPLVTQTYYKGGVAVPTSSLRPVATWVAEGVGSAKQKLGTGSIVFGYHKLRCAVAMTYEVSSMAYPVFERFFVKSVADAMVKAKEIAILTGTGSGQPKGILTETPEAEITVADSGLTYANLVAAEAAEVDSSAIWVMSRAAFLTNVYGMVADNKAPLVKSNFDLAGRPEYTIFGRRVVLVNPEYMPEGTLGLLFNFSDYILNNAAGGMYTKWYEDNETDDQVLKAVDLVDGRAIQTQSLVVLKADA